MSPLSWLAGRQSQCIVIVFRCFCFCMFIVLITPPTHLELSRGIAVINDEQRGLASETRMAAPHPQLAISLASINI